MFGDRVIAVIGNVAERHPMGTAPGKVDVVVSVDIVSCLSALRSVMIGRPIRRHLEAHQFKKTICRLMCNHAVTATVVAAPSLA